MAEQLIGKVDILVGDNKDASISLNGTLGDVTIGGAGQSGDLILKDNSGNVRMKIKASTGTIDVYDRNGKVMVKLDAGANLSLGGANNQDGDVMLKDRNGIARLHLDAQNQSILIRNTEGKTFSQLGRNGQFTLGCQDQAGKVIVRNSSNDETINIDGESGDIVLKNADCAEEFDIAEAIASKVEAGSVMTIQKDGALAPCTQAYDKRVAGVVSGAGTYQPALILDKQPEQENRLPIAMIGKVYCKVDASYGPIELGDLLTTSPTPGHAMKATDPMRAFGTVIGKALGSLENGEGMLPILVALQ